jgi:hypothetical protein
LSYGPEFDNRGIVDYDIDIPKRLVGFIEEMVNIGFNGNIGVHRDGFATFS